jgi:hypothetical protein
LGYTDFSESAAGKSGSMAESVGNRVLYVFGLGSWTLCTGVQCIYVGRRMIGFGAYPRCLDEVVRNMCSAHGAEWTSGAKVLSRIVERRSDMLTSLADSCFDVAVEIGCEDGSTGKMV